MVDLRSNLPEKKFRWAWWAILLSLTPFLLLLPGFLLIGLSVWLLFRTFVDNPTTDTGMLGLVCLAPLLLVLALLILSLLLLLLGELIFSYVKITPSGIEYRKWPNYGIRCKWEDVERKGVHRVLGLIPYDVLYLKQADPVGRQVTMRIRQRLGLHQLLIVSLTGIHGWPNGQFAEQLQNYIPEIMAGRSQDGEGQ